MNPELTLWSQLLSIANTVLMLVAGFLARDAWTTIHRRIDALEDHHGDMRERVASLEESRRSGPHRRRGEQPST